MSEQDTTSTAKPVKRVVDLFVRCDFPHANQYFCYIHGNKPIEEQEKIKRRNLQDAVREFTDFLRDHRSQDIVDMGVVEVTEEVCSICGDKWEPADDDEGTYCACCGARVSKETTE